MTDDPSTSLAPVQATVQLPAVSTQAGGGVLSANELALYVSGRLETEEQRLHAMQAVTAECAEARNLDGKEIACSLIVGCHTKEMEDETGEVYLGRKFIFISPAGEMVKASGRTIPQTVALLAATFGIGPWDPPVLLRVRCKANPPPKSPTVFLDCLGRAKPAQAKAKVK